MRGVRHALGVRPVYKTVDTCAAEFAALTPYHYSTYDEETEVAPRERPAVIILGSGPNRIGQGVEFDYSCVHASFALRDAGYDTVMVNCNPETVSTDYDTSSRLYFEPLTLEDVLEVVHAETQAGPDRRRHRAARRADPARPGQGAQGRGRAHRRHQRPRPSTSPRTVAPSAGCCTTRTCRRPSTAPPTARPRRSRSPRRSATRCWCGRPTCSAGAAWRSSTTTRRCRATSSARPSPTPTTRCSSTASSTTPSRSTSTCSTTAPRCTSAGSWSTSRRPASTPATPRARCRR